jgi:hypothetical protein
MILGRYGWLIVIAIACAAGSYVATYAVQRQGRTDAASCGAAESVAGWLDLTRQQAADVREIETSFAADRARLEANLAAERERLATLLENQSASSDDIMQQVEIVIAANNALERRVAANVIALRPHLTGEQQKLLFDRLSRGVREGGGWRWRHGQAGNLENERRGGGPPVNRGPGRGRGQGFGPNGRGRHGEQATTTPAPESQGVQP